MFFCLLFTDVFVLVLQRPPVTKRRLSCEPQLLHGKKRKITFITEEFLQLQEVVDVLVFIVSFCNLVKF